MSLYEDHSRITVTSAVLLIQNIHFEATDRYCRKEAIMALCYRKHEWYVLLDITILYLPTPQNQLQHQDRRRIVCSKPILHPENQLPDTRDRVSPYPTCLCHE